MTFYDFCLFEMITGAEPLLGFGFPESGGRGDGFPKTKRPLSSPAIEQVSFCVLAPEPCSEQ